MNKADLIGAIASESKLTKVNSKKALEAFLKVASGTLKKGEKITLVGFGTFSVAKRASRTARNPRSGKEVKVPARKVAKFSPGAGLKSMIK